MAEEQGKPYGRLIAKAWTDEDFKDRLKTDPKSAMNEVGMDAPEGVEAEVVESTQEKAGRYPQNPSVSSLTKTWTDSGVG